MSKNTKALGSELNDGLGGEVFKVEYHLSLEFQATSLDGIRDRLPKGAQIIAINDREFVGFCECCGKAICEGDGYYAPEDCYLCRPCGDELKNDAQRRHNRPDSRAGSKTRADHSGYRVRIERKVRR